MAPEKPQSDAFLAAIEAKIAAWTAVRESYRMAVSLDGPVDPGNVMGPHIGSTTRLFPPGVEQALPVGIFRDKSLKEAIPIYLGAGHRKQTNKEIAGGLQAGGFPTMAENFEATVATALYRLKQDGVVLRFSDGWDVASSYPDSMRNRLEKDAKPRNAGRQRNVTKRRSAAPSRAKAAVKQPRKRRTAADGPSIDDEIMKILTADGPTAPSVFAARFGKASNVIGLAVGRLAKLGRAKRLANGSYAAVQQQESLLRAI